MTDELPWLTLTEAAEKTGLARETIRSRARRGLIPSRRSNSGGMLVQIAVGPDREITGAQTGPDRALTEVVTELQEEIADLRDRLTRAESERDRAREMIAERVASADRLAAAKIETAEAKIAATERIIARLENDLARASRPWWRRIFD
jgi:DNA-binding transcriptional MerR regulator